MSDSRLSAVYDAASYLFIKTGYARTQVSQIADLAGIATGTIYSLFSGKKSILHFVLLCTLDQEYLERAVELPVQEVETRLITEHLSRVAEELFSRLETKQENGEPALKFIDMLSLVFDYASNYQVAFNIIDNNPSLLGEVAKEYMRYINKLYQVIEHSLEHFIERGEVRNIELPELHIRNIVEGIIWWSMYLPYRAPHRSVPGQQSKRIALDILKHAYMVNP